MAFSVQLYFLVAFVMSVSALRCYSGNEVSTHVITCTSSEIVCMSLISSGGERQYDCFDRCLGSTPSVRAVCCSTDLCNAAVTTTAPNIQPSDTVPLSSFSFDVALFVFVLFNCIY